VRIVLAAVLLAACVAPPTKMHVSLFPSAYSAAMSSTPGLGLTPVSEPPKGVPVRYRYHATQGFFVTWDENTREITRHGAEYVTLSSKVVYWTYDPAIATGVDSAVRLSVITEHAKSGKPLARADFNLAWDGQVFRAQH
jgi:hypothetical protein